MTPKLITKYDIQKYNTTHINTSQYKIDMALSFVFLAIIFC